MIVCTCDNTLLLVRQTDHMTLSGRLADAWGNDRFARPVPFEPLALAADEHDIGWAAWESAPEVDPATKWPYQFFELPIDRHLAFYREGINAVAAKDAHAGLLVNLHCQGFHNQRFGLAPDLPLRQHTPEQLADMRQSLAAIQSQQRELGQRLRINLPTLWTQYELLQVYDRLSLYLCMPPLKEGELGSVPVGVGGELVSLKLQPVEGSAVEVSPWPFRERLLMVDVAARRVPLRDYENNEDLRQALAMADAVTWNYALRPV